MNDRNFDRIGAVSAAILGSALRSVRPNLGMLGVVLGADMLALFVATAFGVGAVVLATGGLASVVLGPMWWIGVARLLWAGPARHSRPATAATRMTSAV